MITAKKTRVSAQTKLVNMFKAHYWEESAAPPDRESHAGEFPAVFLTRPGAPPVLSPIEVAEYGDDLLGVFDAAGGPVFTVFPGGCAPDKLALLCNEAVHDLNAVCDVPGWRLRSGAPLRDGAALLKVADNMLSVQTEDWLEVLLRHPDQGYFAVCRKDDPGFVRIVSVDANFDPSMITVEKVDLSDFVELTIGEKRPLYHELHERAEDSFMLVAVWGWCDLLRQFI